MKKICCLFLCAVAVIFALSGCSGAVSKKFKSCISENTFGLASAMDEKFKVDYKWGEREDPYAGDGLSMPKVEYGVITVTSLTGKLKNHAASYNIEIDGKTYDGDFLVNPYDQTFVIDLQFVPRQTTNFLFELKTSEGNIKYTLNNVLSKGDADCNEAIKIAENTLKSALKEKLAKNEKYEIYVRLINSQNKDFKPCWYVSLYTTKNQLFAVAIDPNSRIVLARKV